MRKRPISAKGKCILFICTVMYMCMYVDECTYIRTFFPRENTIIFSKFTINFQFTVYKCKKKLLSAGILESKQRKEITKQKYNDTVFRIYNITTTK